MPTHSPLALAVAAIDREDLAFADGVRETLVYAFAKDNGYTLFRPEDWLAWVTFTCVFTALIIFDNSILNRRCQQLTFRHAVACTLFWMLCACSFCGWVRVYYGPDKAFMWISGYVLEWMLSFDNLFVFHMIFQVYATPDHLKHRPLYLGIIGAVMFRLLLIFIGEYLMHTMFFMHFLFGSFLIYTGAKTVAVQDDGEDDPSQLPVVQWLQKRMPFVSAYDEHGAFFVRVPVDASGAMRLTDNSSGIRPDAMTALMLPKAEDCERKYGTIDFQSVKNQMPSGTRTEYRATMLFLVVICLEVSDIMFAVDSVSAIVAQVNDLFLAYTSAVFAMLGLRATFFIIDVLVKIFSLLKYGVGSVLIFVGVKLMIGRYYTISPGIVCAVLAVSIGGSMIASVIKECLFPEEAAEAKKDEVA